MFGSQDSEVRGGRVSEKVGATSAFCHPSGQANICNAACGPAKSLAGMKQRVSRTAGRREEKAQRRETQVRRGQEAGVRKMGPGPMSLKETHKPGGAGVETQFSGQPQLIGNNNVTTATVKGLPAAGQLTLSELLLCRALGVIIIIPTLEMTKLRPSKVTDLSRITGQRVVEREPDRRQLLPESRGSPLPRALCLSCSGFSD